MREMEEELAEKDPPKYNGWTNYETWVVNLWLSNDAGAYRKIRELAQGNTKANKSFDTLVEKLRFFVENGMIRDFNGLSGDLLISALGRVNWEEIAYSVLED